MSIIEVKDLEKKYRINIKREGLQGAIANLFYPVYKIKEAVKGISFNIEEGELIGYVGENGAGKSTTIKMLSGILKPTSGKVTVNGLDPYKNRIKNNMNIGFVFGQRTQMWWDLPVIESYRFIQKIYEVPKKRFNQNLGFYTEFLELNDLLEVPVRQLSLGQKMRCEMAAAFIHDPKIVFLDEPTIGLDFRIKEKIRQFIRTINKEKNITVLLTTHDLKDIEKICDRMIVIDKGRIIYEGELTKIKDEFYEISTISIQIQKLNFEIKKVLNNFNDRFSIMFKDENNMIVKFNKNVTTFANVIGTISPYCDIYDLSIEEISIEDIVRNLYDRHESTSKSQ